MTRSQASEWDCGRKGVSMYTEIGGASIGSVEHHIVWPKKLSFGHDLESQAQYVSPINSIRIRVADLECRDGGGDAMEALLDVRLLKLCPVRYL